MMNKRISAAVCLFVLIWTLGACRLAREDGAAAAGEDRLIGVFITTEYLDLFDFEGYMNDNLTTMGGKMTIDGNNSKYNGRLYATTAAQGVPADAARTSDYVFEGVDGIRYFMVTRPATESENAYHAGISDAGIADGHSYINVGDEGESVSLEATVYVSPAASGHTVYFNPVYQDKDGKVYVISGTSCSNGGGENEGTAFSQTMTASTTITKNGKSMTNETSVTVSVSIRRAPEKIVFLQLSEDNAVITRIEYAPGEVPQSILPSGDTAYLIAESYSTDSEGRPQVDRVLCGKDDDYVRSYHCREDGILIAQDTRIDWQQMQ